MGQKQGKNEAKIALYDHISEKFLAALFGVSTVKLFSLATKFETG